MVEITSFNHIHSYYHRKAKKVLSEVELTHPLDNLPGFPSNAKLKMQWYMAEFAYTCERINQLVGISSSKKQQRMYLLSGLLVAMCDLIIDDVHMDLDRAQQFLRRPTNDLKPKDLAEKLHLHFYKLFTESLEVDVNERVLVYYEKLFEAQIKSKRQFETFISLKEVDEICKEKGGYSTLFLRAMVKWPISLSDERVWYELGAFIQFCNDSQDMYNDLQKEMRTFATVRSNLHEIENDLEKQRSKVFELFEQAHYDSKRKNDFLFTLHVMSSGIQTKLKLFDRICDHDFSFEKLKSKSKSEVRSQMSAINLLWHGFSKVFEYKNV